MPKGYSSLGLRLTYAYYVQTMCTSDYIKTNDIGEQA